MKTIYNKLTAVICCLTASALLTACSAKNTTEPTAASSLTPETHDTVSASSKAASSVSSAKQSDTDASSKKAGDTDTASKKTSSISSSIFSLIEEPSTDIDEYLYDPNVLRQKAAENPYSNIYPAFQITDSSAPAGLSGFSTQLFKECFDSVLSENNGEPQNMVISPLSAYIVLSMTANGAVGDTKTDMTNALGADIAALNGDISAYVTKTQREESVLQTANSVFLIKDNVPTLVPSFEETARNTYFSEVFHESASEETVSKINSWVSDNTKGMIPGIVSREDINDNTTLILLNTAAFDAKWQTEFKEWATTQKDFHNADGSVSTADFMEDSECYIITDSKATGFLKPYKNEENEGNFCFGALLPDEGVSVTDYVSSLSCDHIIDMVKSTADIETIITIPKFTFDGQYMLNTPLQNMGMISAFDPGRADFSELAASDKSIYISDVVQKTFIEVTEHGTKAAAVTGAFTVQSSVCFESPNRILFDRPFVFFIYDIDSNIPVFIGTVCSL